MARPPARRGRLVMLVAMLALCALLAGGRGLAAAATGVAGADPPPGAHLAGTPGGLRMQFVAPVESSFVVLEFWQDGRVASLPARIDPTDPQAVIAAMRRAAGRPGQVWVRYRVLTGDGHVVGGRYAVQVGAGGPGVAPPAQLTSAGGAWLTGIGRAFVLAGLVVALGLVVLRWGVAGPAWQAGGVVAPGRADDVEGFRRRTLTALARGAGTWWAVWWSALAAWLIGAVLIGIGVCWWLGVGASGLGTLLVHTRTGHAIDLLMIIVVVTALAAVLLGRRTAADRPDVSLGWGVALGLGAAAGVMVMSWQGHASDGTDVSINIAADAIHAIATAAWVGGLVGLLVLVVGPAQDLPTDDRVRLLAGAVVRFSSLAIAAVAVLVITGTYRALAELSSLSQLVTTGYGIALTVKLAIFAVMLVAGGYSRTVLHPRLERTALGLDADERGASRALRASLRAELVLAASLMVAVAVLVAMTPPG
jgi:putative copper export protein/methionine-rich copper-binding protein CopC